MIPAPLVPTLFDHLIGIIQEVIIKMFVNLLLDHLVLIRW